LYENIGDESVRHGNYGNKTGYWSKVVVAIFDQWNLSNGIPFYRKDFEILNFCVELDLFVLYSLFFSRFFPFQELIAYGTGNIAGSFFSCFPICNALARTAVQENQANTHVI
jgi:hypothetical protein